MCHVIHVFAVRHQADLDIEPFGLCREYHVFHDATEPNVHLTSEGVDYTDLTAVIRVEVDCLFIDTEMPGLRIVRVGSQNARTYDSFRTRRAVAPILPGFIGDALKHALVN